MQELGYQTVFLPQLTTGIRNLKGRAFLDTHLESHGEDRRREDVKGILSKLAEKCAKCRYQGNTCISNEQDDSFIPSFTCDSRMEPFVSQCVERMF